MSIENKKLIEKYFENQLSKDEKLIFEEKIINDEGFSKAFEFERNVKKSIHLTEREALKVMLKGFDKKPHRRVISFRNWYWLSAAAMIILGVLFWLSTENKPSIEDLYLSYYQNYPNVVEPIVRGEGNQGDKNEAFEAYEQEKYQKSKVLFHNIFDKTKAEYALFYESQSYFALGETQKGIDILENASFTDNKYQFKTQQKWYLALAYLKLNKIENAKKYLYILAKSENIQQENASNLLKLLP